MPNKSFCHSVAVIGPNTQKDVVHPIQSSLGNEHVVGDGVQDLSLHAVKNTLEHSPPAHLNICMHGQIRFGKHVVQTGNFVLTRDVLSKLKDAKSTIHIWSCQAEAAKNEVTVLHEGTSLICHSGKFSTLRAMNAEGITRLHAFSQEVEKEHGCPANAAEAFEFALLTSPETVNFSQVVDGKVEFFKASAPKHACTQQGLEIYHAHQLREFRHFRKTELGHDPSVFIDMHSIQTQENRKKYLEDALLVETNRGKKEYVESYLEIGINPNVSLSDGKTGIYIAANDGDTGLVELFIAKGADPTIADSYGYTPLMDAAYNGRLDTIQALLASDKISIEHLQTKGPIGDVTEVASAGNTPEAEAILSTIEEKLKEILSQEIDPNRILENGQTPFDIACLCGYSSIVEGYLKNGADPTLPDTNGYTPLMAATINGHLDTVQVLLSSERVSTLEHLELRGPIGDATEVASAEIASAGSTPEAEAILSAIEEKLKDCLSQEVDPNRILEDEQIPFGVACVYGYSSIVEGYLENGTDPTIANSEGYTPLMVAAYNGYEAIVDQLLNHPDITLEHLQTRHPEYGSAAELAHDFPVIEEKINHRIEKLSQQKEKKSERAELPSAQADLAPGASERQQSALSVITAEDLQMEMVRREAKPFVERAAKLEMEVDKHREHAKVEESLANKLENTQKTLAGKPIVHGDKVRQFASHKLTEEEKAIDPGVAAPPQQKSTGPSV